MTSLKGESIPRRACRFTGVAGDDGDSFRSGFLQISLSSQSPETFKKTHGEESFFFQFI